MLFNIAKDMAHKMPLIKMVFMDSDPRPHLDELLVAVLYKAWDAICVPEKQNMIELVAKEFESFLVNETAKIYDSFSMLA